MTPKRKAVFAFIAKFMNANGYAPTYREIGDGVGLHSLATVHKHIQLLDIHGYIDAPENKSRSIALTKKGKAYADDIHAATNCICECHGVLVARN